MCAILPPQPDQQAVSWQPDLMPKHDEHVLKICCKNSVLPLLFVKNGMEGKGSNSPIGAGRDDWDFSGTVILIRWISSGIYTHLCHGTIQVKGSTPVLELSDLHCWNGTPCVKCPINALALYRSELNHLSPRKLPYTEHSGL